MPTYVPVAVRRAFWLLVREGVLPGAAAVAVGMSARVGRQWFRDAGGMSPLALDPVKDPVLDSVKDAALDPVLDRVLDPVLVAAGRGGRYLRLTVEEREVIEDGVADGLSIREIARRIDRQPSTVQRELDRNRTSRRPVRYRSRAHTGARARLGSSPVGRPGTARYRARLAQRRAELEARRPRAAKLANNQRLRAVVQDRLDARHSPEQIASRLGRDFADDPEMQVSHETIYRALYLQGRGALRRELTACLRTGRAIRRPRRQLGQRDQRRTRDRIPDLVGIAERPAEADDRAVPGHWESQCCCQAA